VKKNLKESIIYIYQHFREFVNLKQKKLRRISIDTVSHKSEILIGENWKEFLNLTRGKQVVILTDDNLLHFYGNDFGNIPFVSITPGESSKKLETIDHIAKRLLDLGVDRDGLLVGIGGGVVCDIAGFVASIYMRGIRFGFVSTSLLSQVDASVGGKNGVNSGSVKNILGTFNQPDFVICDQGILRTLPEDEYLSGLVELIKHGAICDEELFSIIESNTGLIKSRDQNFLTDLIGRSVEIKAVVVREDEKETGRRMVLNFGHTFGHAIEAHTCMKHGFAVAAGMIIAADISVESGILERKEKERLSALLGELGLIKPYEITTRRLQELIASDKKKSGDAVNFVLIEKIGKSVVKKISVPVLIENYKSIYSIS
jgi:3-dehydroquinate synthase